VATRGERDDPAFTIQHNWLDETEVVANEFMTSKSRPRVWWGPPGRGLAPATSPRLSQQSNQIQLMPMSTPPRFLPASFAARFDKRNNGKRG
jgi:hypothetical protein